QRRIRYRSYEELNPRALQLYLPQFDAPVAGTFRAVHGCREVAVTAEVGYLRRIGRLHPERRTPMKVVLFCGGLGLRIRDAEEIPKPMVNIGYRPILWHVMKYYAHYGHKDFILCLGYRADAIKNYFLNYDECTSNDFVLTGGGTRLQLFN